MKNMKCTSCGYKFQGDEAKENGTCPLCSEEYNTEKAIEYYNLTSDNEDTSPRSTGRIIRDWVIFGVAFGLFIVIMNFLISFIANYKG